MKKMKALAKIAATYLGKMGNTPAFTRTKKEIVVVIFTLGEIGKSIMWQSLRQARTSRTQH